MFKDSIQPKDVINLLNELLEIDQRAVEGLFNFRIGCNKKMAEHKTVQVGCLLGGDYHVFGIIGILNGLFGTDKEGWGCIAVDLDKENKIKRFRLLEERIKNSIKY